MSKNMKKGMSLIELIIYIGLMSIVLVAMTDLASRLVFSQNKTNQTAEVSDNLGFAMSKLTTDINNATSVSGTYPANTLTLTVENQELQYSLSGDTLTLSKNGQAPVDITSSKVSVGPPEGSQIFTKVTNGSANTIAVKMIFSLKSDEKVSQTAQTSILLRGK